MAQFSLTEYIEAPPAEVFARASDFASAPRTIAAIKKVEMVTDGPVGVGTRFRETRMVFKRKATEEMTVTAFDPPRAYTLGCDSCGCRYDFTFDFEPRGTGTAVTLVFNARPLTLMARVMGVLFRFMLKMCVKETARDLADLKRALETPERALSPS